MLLYDLLWAACLAATITLFYRWGYRNGARSQRIENARPTIVPTHNVRLLTRSEDVYDQEKDGA